MHPLDLKLFRDIGRMKGQTLAVSLIMACGLAMMIMAKSLVFSLESTREDYYGKYRFGEVFCDLKRAPNLIRKQIEQIDGVAAVETRTVGRVTLDLPEMKEPADGTIVSLPDERAPVLNLLYLREGRFPSLGKRDEVLVGEPFAIAHGFKPGDTIPMLIRGQREILKVTGIALSPEYVFEARPGDTLPDNKRYGIFWMNERALSVAMDTDGAFNNVVVDVAPGANPQAVVAELDRILDPYGGLGSYTRKDHPSAQRLNDELQVLHGLGFIFPIVFLSIAAFMTSAALTRLVRLQREQIAQLKAFGYSSWQVGLHYLKFALVIVAIGIIVGALAGLWLGGNVVNVYHRFFKFPYLPFRVEPGAILLAFFFSAAASFLGVAGAVRQAMKLPPAEAMRPEPPAEFKPSILERLGFTNIAGTTFRMALRNIERRPWQAFFTAFGLALATAIPIVPGTLKEGVGFLIHFQWDWASHQDATLTLIEPGSAATLDDFRQLPGVLSAEPFRSSPARIRYGHRSRRISLMGVPRDLLLNRVLNVTGDPVALPPDGLLVSAKLAELLGLKPGENVTIEIQEGERPVRQATVQGTVTDYTGLSAYMEIGSLRRLLREGGTVSGVHVALDPEKVSEFLKAVKEAPKIGSLSIKNASRSSFEKTTAESINMIQGLYFTFSIVVAFGVVYNSARIALSERSRDLATLRVIGFSNGEVSSILISELLLLTAAAIPVGLLIGSGLATLIVATAATETIRIPLVFTTRSYATAVLIVLISAGFSFAIVNRRIRQLDLIGVLKARD